MSESISLNVGIVIMYMSDKPEDPLKLDVKNIYIQRDLNT